MMAADDQEQPQPSDEAPSAKSGRRQRTPVTIDLEAKPVDAKPEDAGAATTAPGSEAAPTDEAAPASEDAAGEETAADGPAEAASSEEDAAAAASEEAATPPETPETPKTPEPPEPPVPPVAVAQAPRGGGTFRVVVAGILGGLVALAIILGLEAAGVLPWRKDESASQALAKANDTAASVADLQSRVGAVETALGKAAKAADVEALGGRIAALESEANALKDKLAGLEQAPPPAPVATDSAAAAPSAALTAALDSLKARVDKLENAPAPAPAPVDTGLTDRVASLEAAVQRLSTRLDGLAAQTTPAAAGDRAARAIAIAMLRQASSAGGPFASDLAVVETLGISEGDLARLKPLAEKGAPSKAELADRFPAVADKMLAAADTVDPQAGLFARLMARARHLVSIRPVSPVSGDSPEAIVSRMQAAVTAGDFAKALAERDALPQAAKLVSSAWADDAGNRVAIDRLVTRIAEAAAAAPGK